MKTRGCFVSNSSSSSFIIGVKGKLTEEKLMKAFRVGKDSPLYPISKSIAGVMLGAEAYTKKELIKDNYYEDESELTELENKIFDNGFKYYSGTASDEDSYDGAETALCNMDLDYEDDDIIIYKESGY